MYLPEQFARTDLPALHAVMRAHSFAIVITRDGGAPFVSHLPLALKPDAGAQGSLIGHMARNNPQWRHFADGQEILIVFSGPHAYVSPSAYEVKSGTVPTWNYIAVHAWGRARILPDDELERALHGLVEANEQGVASSWKLAITPNLRERLLPGIVGFEVALHRIEGKFKLSQNRSEQDRKGVIDYLSRSEQGRDVARWMNAEAERT